MCISAVLPGVPAAKAVTAQGWAGRHIRAEGSAAVYRPRLGGGSSAVRVKRYGVLRNRNSRPFGVDRYTGAYRGGGGKFRAPAVLRGVPAAKLIAAPGGIGGELRRGNGGSGAKAFNRVGCFRAVVQLKRNGIQTRRYLNPPGVDRGIGAYRGGGGKRGPCPVRRGVPAAKAIAVPGGIGGEVPRGDGSCRGRNDFNRMVCFRAVVQLKRNGIGTRRRLNPLGVNRYIGVYRGGGGKFRAAAVLPGVPAAEGVTAPGGIGGHIRAEGSAALHRLRLGGGVSAIGVKSYRIDRRIGAGLFFNPRQGGEKGVPTGRQQRRQQDQRG